MQNRYFTYFNVYVLRGFWKKYLYTPTQRGLVFFFLVSRLQVPRPTYLPPGQMLVFFFHIRKKKQGLLVKKCQGGKFMFYNLTTKQSKKFKNDTSSKLFYLITTFLILTFNKNFVENLNFVQNFFRLMKPPKYNAENTRRNKIISRSGKQKGLHCFFLLRRELFGSFSIFLQSKNKTKPLFWEKVLCFGKNGRHVASRTLKSKTGT